MYALTLILIIYTLYAPLFCLGKKREWKKPTSCYVCGKHTYTITRGDQKIAINMTNLLINKCLVRKNHIVCFDCDQTGWMYSGCVVCLKFRQYANLFENEYYYDHIVLKIKMKRLHYELKELFRKKVCGDIV
jgi:hypothetical protein